MHLEDLKFWHWTIIGLLVGLLYGGIKLSEGPWFDKEGLETLDQPTFDREVAGLLTPTPRHDRQLLQIYHAGQPLLRNLVVHVPIAGEPTHSYWVTGQYYKIFQENEKPGVATTPIMDKSTWVDFKYRAFVPYHSTVTLPGRYPTVIDFLAAVKKNYPNAAIPYRFAWFEQAQITMIFLPTAGLLLIGIAWPLTLMLMQGAGIARAPQSKVSLPKQRRLSPAGKKPKDHTADDLKLAALNEQMDKSLGGFGSSSSPGETSSTPGSAPVKTLAGADVTAPAAAPPTKEELERKYGGEFYPVVREIHKKK